MAGPQGKQQTPASLGPNGRAAVAFHDDPTVGEISGVQTDAEGRFRVERLVPGQKYSAEIYRGWGGFAGVAFENLVLAPGEVRDLGDVRSKPPVSVIGK